MSRNRLIIIQDILKDRFGIEPEEILPSTKLEDLLVDSLDLMDFILDLDEEFDVDIPEAQIAGFRTVQDIISYLQEAQA